MGQKTNPISLRLNINRNFDSCWFQDKSFGYSKLLQQDLKIREYVKSLFNFVGVHTGRISVQIFPKKLVLHYFFHDTDRKSRKSSNKKYKISSGSKVIEENGSLVIESPKASSGNIVGYASESTDRGRLSISDLRSPSNYAKYLHFLTVQSEFLKSHGSSGCEQKSSEVSNFQDLKAGNDLRLVRDSLDSKIRSLKELKKRIFIRFLLTRFYSSQNKNIFQVQNFIRYSYHSLFQPENLIRELTDYNIASSTINTNTFGDSPRYVLLEEYKSRRKNLILDTNLEHIESILTKNFKSNSVLLPMKIYSRYKSAQFISEYVCQRIQQNIPFRQIYKQLLLEIKKHDEIQGMRIVCSGRLGGVEMARVESRKYGQTSLHVFSSKIDFASDQAYTLFGLIGVKVWICFREK
jgi:ribosomal protein S3